MKRNKNKDPAPVVLVAKKSAAERDEIFSIVSAADMTPRAVGSLKEIRQLLNDTRPFCLVADLVSIERMLPGMIDSLSGQGIKLPLTSEARRSPTLVISAQLLRQRTSGQRGVALLGGSFKKQQLLRAIERTVAWDRISGQRVSSREEMTALAEKLSERDQQIMRLIYDGLSNKVIANRLELGLRTIESARARIFQQMGVETAVDLVRTLALADYYDEAAV